MNRDWYEDLEGVIRQIGQSYAIWWELVNPENGHGEALMDLHAFFTPSVTAHFDRVVIGVGQLFDRTKGTKSIAHALPRLRSLYPDVANEVDERLAGWTQSIERIVSIRHNVTAHLNASASSEVFFEQAAITPEGLGSLIATLQDVLATIGTIYRPVETSASMWKMQAIDAFESDARIAREHVQELFERMS